MTMPRPRFTVEITGSAGVNLPIAEHWPRDGAKQPYEFAVINGNTYPLVIQNGTGIPVTLQPGERRVFHARTFDHNDGHSYGLEYDFIYGHRGGVPEQPTAEVWNRHTGEVVWSGPLWKAAGKCDWFCAQQRGLERLPVDVSALDSTP